MDVRLSPEQDALRDSVAQVVDRLGPHAVGELADTERAAKLDAAVAASGWRELRTANDDGSPWASGVEVALVAGLLVLEAPAHPVAAVESRLEHGHVLRAGGGRDEDQGEGGRYGSIQALRTIAYGPESRHC